MSGKVRIVSQVRNDYGGTEYDVRKVSLKAGVFILRPEAHIRPAKTFCQSWKNDLRKICWFGRM